MPKKDSGWCLPFNLLALSTAKAEWIFCGRNSLQVNFFQPILVGGNQVAEDPREVFSVLKSSIEIRKEKDMLLWIRNTDVFSGT